jgi:hypothetical protein
MCCWIPGSSDILKAWQPVVFCYVPVHANLAVSEAAGASELLLRQSWTETWDQNELFGRDVPAYLRRSVSVHGKANRSIQRAANCERWNHPFRCGCPPVVHQEEEVMLTHGHLFHGGPAPIRTPCGIPITVFYVLVGCLCYDEECYRFHPHGSLRDILRDDCCSMSNVVALPIAVRLPNLFNCENCVYL